MRKRRVRVAIRRASETSFVVHALDADKSLRRYPTANEAYRAILNSPGLELVNEAEAAAWMDRRAAARLCTPARGARSTAAAASGPVLTDRATSPDARSGQLDLFGDL